MFDLDALDAELERRFRKPERRLQLPFNLSASEKISALAIGVALCTTTVMAANVTGYDNTPRAPMTSEMTYDGLTIEEFAKDVGISIYDPYVLVLFEDLCMQEPADTADA